MSQEDWKTLAAVLSSLAQLLAVAAAGGFFVLRWRRGAQITNLTVSVTCDRSASLDANFDWLAVRVYLKKLDRYSLKLHDVQARVTSGHQNEIRTFWGRDRFRQYDAVQAKHKRIDWEVVDSEDPLINLTPGEETQLGAVFSVPSGVPCQVDVVILGEHFGWITGKPVICAQWNASTVALPITEPRNTTEPGRQAS